MTIKSDTVKPDMKSPTGILLTIVKVASYTASFKQTSNLKSFMESALVAVEDGLGQVLWKMHF